MRRRPDIELVVLAREGSREAAGVLFDRYWLLAWRAAYALTADRETANDAAQEAMERAFDNLDRFDETRPFAPWLKRIAVNRAVDLLRKDRRLAVPREGETTLHEWSVGPSAEDDLRLWTVSDAVASLPLAQRSVVVLHYWLDFSLEEIAGILGIPFGTVASRISRARSELRALLESDRVV